MKYINNNIQVIEKLISLYTSNQIPNIIFYGKCGSGKKSILRIFLKKIYENFEPISNLNINDYIMIVNCSHNKGIKFIREDLKFFAKSSVFTNSKEKFKSIILLNADHLTNDAQSALRRSIELFSHNTRFFILIEDKSKLLTPILSRFSHIHIPGLEHNNTFINFYSYTIKQNKLINNYEKNKMIRLKTFVNLKFTNSYEKLIENIETIYKKGFTPLDVIRGIELNIFNIQLTLEYKTELLILFDKIKMQYVNDKLLFLFIFYSLYFNNKEINVPILF